MRGATLTCSLLAVGFVAFAGSGCDLKTPLQPDQPHPGGTSGTDAGAAGASGGSATCVAEMGPNGVCKRCYDASGVLVHEDCPMPPPDPPPPPTTCTQGTDMNGRVCKTCVDATGMVVSTDCDSGVPGMMCVDIQDGGPTSCKDAATWKQYGTDRCAQQNMVLTNVRNGTPCGPNYQDVTYTCCATAPGGSTGTGGANGAGGAGGGTTVGPGRCLEMGAGDPTACKSYDAWKLDAYNQCLLQNLPLTDLAVGPACDGGYLSITFTCCAGTGGPSPSPPPPVPTPGSTGSGGASGG